MITITRKFDFDYGHRVLRHEGKCRFLHGHRGVAEVTVQAPKLDALGMVIDFAEIKRLVGCWIGDNWDHNLLLSAADPQLHHLQQTEDRQPYVMARGNPTAENMAAELWSNAIRLLPDYLTVVSVRIWETPNCCADYVPDGKPATS